MNLGDSFDLCRGSSVANSPTLLLFSSILVVLLLVTF